MSFPRPKVLLADFIDAEASARMPELFKKAGAEVEVFCSKKSWFLKNSYTSIWHRRPAAAGEYASALIKLVTENNFAWVVFTDDASMRLVEKEISDPVLFTKIFPLTNIAHRGLLGSKAGFSKLCTEYNLPTPKFLINDGRLDTNIIAKELRFPILLKVDKSGGGKGVFLVNDLSELEKTFELLIPEQKNNLVFQEYIYGDNIAVEVLYKNGILGAYVSAKVLANVNGEFGISRLREYFVLPGLENLLKKFGQAMGINGFVNMTIMQSQATGELFIIEADLRPQGWVYLVKLLGVNFSEAIAWYLSPEINPPKVWTNQNTKILRYFSREFQWAVKNNDWRSVLGWFVNAKNCWEFVPFDDQKLFWATVGDIGKHSLYYLKPLRPVTRTIKGWYTKLYGFFRRN